MTIHVANGSPGLQNCEGKWGKQKLHVKDLMKQHPMLFCTSLPGNREAWLVKRKEQTLYWALNELLTNIHLSINIASFPGACSKSDFSSECLGTRLEHYSVAVVR